MPSFTRPECGMAYLPAQYGALLAQPWKVLPGLVDAHRSRLLAVEQASVFDCVPKVDETNGIHSCTGSGDYQFPRDSV